MIITPHPLILLSSLFFWCHILNSFLQKLQNKLWHENTFGKPTPFRITYYIRTLVSSHLSSSFIVQKLQRWIYKVCIESLDNKVPSSDSLCLPSIYVYSLIHVYVMLCIYCIWILRCISCIINTSTFTYFI